MNKKDREKLRTILAKLLALLNTTKDGALREALDAARVQLTPFAEDPPGGNDAETP